MKSLFISEKNYCCKDLEEYSSSILSLEYLHINMYYNICKDLGYLNISAKGFIKVAS